MLNEFKSYFQGLREKVARALGLRNGLPEWDTTSDEIPPAGHPRVADFVNELKADAERYYRDKFAASSVYRNTGNTVTDAESGVNSDPDTFVENCRKLSAGNVYDVFARRKRKGMDWVEEIADQEIGDQIRVKTSHLTAQWHDVQFVPNIGNIDVIDRIERQDTGWQGFIRDVLKNTQEVGHTDVFTTIDKTEDERGRVQEIICEPNSVFFAPYAKSKRKIDGNWYVVWLTNETRAWVREALPDFNFKDVAYGNVRSSQPSPLEEPGLNKGYSHSRTLPVVRLFADDDTLEKIPIEQWDFNVAEADVEHVGLEQGVIPIAKSGENHVKHIEAHQTYIELLNAKALEMQESGILDEGSLKIYQMMAFELQNHIAEHLAFMEDAKEVKLQKKYPHGRHVILVGGKVAYDNANPYRVAWRMLFNRVKNENVLGRLDGRGIPEILWSDIENACNFLSRAADFSVLAAPQTYMDIADKPKENEVQPTNDPREIKYYSGRSPITVSYNAQKEPLEMHGLFIAKTQRRLGVNDITMGQEQPAGTPAKLVELLQQQSAILVTGELNTNMNEFIKALIETRIELYKQFYVEPRAWVISGQEQEIELSRTLLYNERADEQGNYIVTPRGKFDITVKPNSNFWNAFEQDVSLLVSLSEIKYPDGTSIIPPEMLRDIVADEKFPQLNGKYKTISQATSIGLKVMQEQQVQAEKEEKLMNALVNNARKTLVSTPIEE